MSEVDKVSFPGVHKDVARFLIHERNIDGKHYATDSWVMKPNYTPAKSTHSRQEFIGSVTTRNISLDQKEPEVLF